MIITICNILIVILILLMIRKIISNIYVANLNKKVTKLFYYFSIQLLTMGNSNTEDLIVGQMFKRKMNTKSSDMYLTIIGRYDRDETTIKLNRLYYIPTRQLLELMFSNKDYIITEDILKDNLCLYFEYNENTKLIDIYCGRNKLDDIKFQNRLHHLRLLKDVIYGIYNECSMKGNRLNPLLLDFQLYCNILKENGIITRKEDSDGK